MRELGLGTLVASVFVMIAFAQIIVTLFGKDIPSVFVSFFKGAEEFVVLGLIFVFVLAWMRKARPQTRNGSYAIVVFDVFGQITHIDGLRTAFSTNDVATSFAKYYKQMYSMYNFGVLTDIKKARRTIVRYV